MGSSRQTQTTNSTTTAQPWEPVQPLLQNTIGGIQNWLNSPQATQTYQGPRVAQMSGFTQGGLDVLSGGVGVRRATDYANRVLDGEYLNAGNPYMDQLARAVEAQVMPGVNSAFTRAGLTGSSLHQGMLARGLTQGMAPHMFQNYENERQRQMQAASMLPGLDSTRAQQLLTAGGVTEGFDQRNIDAQRMAWEEERLAGLRPYQEAFPMMQALAGMGGTQTTNGTTVSSSRPSLGQQIGGGLMMGASLLAAPYTGGMSLGGLGQGLGMFGGPPAGYGNSWTPWVR